MFHDFCQKRFFHHGVNYGVCAEDVRTYRYDENRACCWLCGTDGQP